MRYWHSTIDSARLAVRAMALQWNFHPYGARLRRDQPSRVSPFDDLNGFQYHPNWLHNLLIASSMARIIHQPEKSTRKGDFEIRMNHQSTGSQASNAPKTISSGRPDVIHTGLMGATRRTMSCQLPGAYLSYVAHQPLGLAIDLRGPTRSGARKPIRSNYASVPAPPGTMWAVKS
jgi:hypothetical protein